MRYLLILFAAVPLYAQTTYTTVAAAGSVSATAGASWVGGIAPPTGCGTAFNVQLADGTTLVVPTSTIFCPGASDGTTAISCTSSGGTGALTVQGELQLRGAAIPCNALWHFAAGSTFTYDSSQAATPSAANWTVGTATHDLTNGGVSLDGTGWGAGQFVTIRKAPGSGNFGGFRPSTVTIRDGGQLRGGYAVVSDCGVATGYCFYGRPAAAAAVFSPHHIRMTGSAKLAVGDIGAASTVDIHDINIQSPLVDAANMTMEFGVSGSGLTTLKTTGTRRFTHSYVSGGGIRVATAVNTDSGFVFSELVGFASGTFVFSQFGTKQFAQGNWTNNLFWQQATAASGSLLPPFPSGYLYRTYELYDWDTEVCGAGVQGNITHTLSVSAGDTTFDGWAIESRCGGSNNKALNFASSTIAGANWPLIVKNSIFMLGSNALGWADPIVGFSNLSCDGATRWCAQVQFSNNTVAGELSVGSQPCGIAGETTTVSAGVFTATANNIWWAPTSRNGCIERYVTVAQAGLYTGTHDYNWTYNQVGTFTAAPTLYDQGTTSVYSAVPGTHDQAGDPQFQETSRNFLKWCQLLNPADASWSDCLAHFATIGTSNYDPRYTVAAVLDYVRNGYISRNTTARTAGSTGGYVGAIAPPVMFPAPSGFAVSR